MIDLKDIPIIHWKTYVYFLQALNCFSEKNMYSLWVSTIKNIHDVVNGQDYSIKDLKEIIYN